ncbi:MAG TPA: AAA family ATPase [Firmicutes bacterium]|nr:AAA family ATPase [Bacillota bacterium]
MHKLSPNELKYHCRIKQPQFTTTEEVPPLEGLLGQERAVRAMEFGLRVKRPGYNIFMTGLTGTGKTSYARSMVQKIAVEEPTPDDWCYVYNFKNPEQPIALNLPAGQGAVFCREMEELVEDLKVVIPKAFDSEDYERQKGTYMKQYQESRSVLLDELNRAAQGQGFTLRRTSSGFATIPLVGGEPVSEEEYAKLSPDEKEGLERKSADLQIKAMEIMRRIQKAEKEIKEQLKQLDQRVGLMAIGYLFNDLSDKYDRFDKVRNYLKAVQEDVLANLGDFRLDEDEQSTPLAWAWLKRPGREQAALRYRVNLVVDHRDTKGAPLVYEANPSYYNLLGRVEYENRLGMVITDFSMIKAGAFHRANGGYLILQARDLLSNLQAWEVLKRSLKANQVCIENMGEHVGLIAMSSLKPAPIPLNLRVILIGNPYLYHLLYQYDEDFQKLFKIKADFEIEMDRTSDNLAKLAGFISSCCRREGLKHFDRSAFCRVVEYSCRLAEHQQKLSTRFNEIVELLYEADTWSGIEGSPVVREEHIRRALQEKVFRSNKIEQKIKEAIKTGQILLEVEGEKTGQINGMSLIDLGDYQFGRPSRITATAYPGKKGIINIERESQLSGRIHDKGVLILSGYLGKRYGRQEPVNLSASLCFEQSYSGVEGDSASAAELLALLSGIGGVPLKQGLAVTGSVNQTGEIQPVGGINPKIEGFYAACKISGLTGEQGVVIPSRNCQNLMLAGEVIQAVSQKEFHIFAIDHIEQGLELLTGMPAGEMDAKGAFPPGSVNYRVVEQLQQFNRQLARQARESKPDLELNS